MHLIFHKNKGVLMKVRQIAARGMLLSAVWLLLGVVGLTALPTASAHNELTGSNPEAGSVLAASPDRLELTFAQEIDADFASVAVTAGTVDLTSKLEVQGRTVNVLLEDLPSGVTGATEATIWKFGYRMISKDGHPVSGLIQFTVDPSTPGAIGASTENTAVQATTGAAATTQTAAVENADEEGSGGIGTAGWVIIALLAVAAVAVPLLLRRRAPKPLPSRRPAATAKGRSRTS